MANKRKQQLFWRMSVYAAGVVTLAIGVAMAAISGLGLLPISAVPFGISKVIGVNFSIVVCLYYCSLVGIEFLVKGKHRELRDLLQLPFSFVFSALLDIFERGLPFHFHEWWQNVVLLFVGILFSGIGIAMMVQMKIIPNPADGLTQALSVRTGKEIGTMKNIVDLICVVVAFLIDLLFGTLFTSVGLGTVLAMIFIGRVIAAFNRCFKDRLMKLTGMDA